MSFTCGFQWLEYVSPPFRYESIFLLNYLFETSWHNSHCDSRHHTIKTLSFRVQLNFSFNANNCSRRLILLSLSKLSTECSASQLIRWAHTQSSQAIAIATNNKRRKKRVISEKFLPHDLVEPIRNLYSLSATHNFVVVFAVSHPPEPFFFLFFL